MFARTRGIIRDHSSKVHIFLDVLTAIYTFLVLYGLYYNGAILKMGLFENIYIVIIFITLEIVKYFVCVKRCRTQAFKSNFKDFVPKILMLLSVFGIVYVFTVLLGAPIFSSFQETTMFGIYLTVFTTVPLCFYFNNDAALNILLKVRLILFGAWLGAVTIPLDWNRPWQQWPIPCCVGGFIGFAFSNCVSSFLYQSYAKDL